MLETLQKTDAELTDATTERHGRFFFFFFTARKETLASSSHINFCDLSQYKQYVALHNLNAASETLF